MNTDKRRFNLRFSALRIGLLLFTIHCSLFTAVAQMRDYTRHVNPFIGTGGHGHTFPGATVPFGMVQLSPDTRIDNWDGSSGYHYSDDIIYGFSHTHLSGTGIPDGADILFMPTLTLQYEGAMPNFLAGNGEKSVNGLASKFSHPNEKAQPGYYSVMLDDEGILAEMTATKRVGFHRYTFPNKKSGFITVNLEWRDKYLDSELRFVGNRRIEGYRRSSSWAKDQKVYFSADFSGEIKEAIRDVGLNDDEEWEAIKHTKAALRFEPIDGKPVLVKVAISYVSIEGARKNLEAELPGWDFDKVRADAKTAWNKELSKIEVSGGTDEQTTNFYTALYHTMIHPNVFNDVDGQYKGHDGKTHNINRRDAETQSGKEAKKNGSKNSASPRLGGESSEQYTVFSLWDTFRAAHPLYTIVDQKRTVDFINTFIRQYEQGGRLPVWELWGEETDTMIGYHAVSVIADAMAKGIKGFDYEKAYAAAKHSAELDHFGLAGYKKRGYISMEDENESVSRTLEYAYNDWCIAQMARVLGGSENGEFVRFIDGRVDIDTTSQYAKDHRKYLARSLSFQNLFDQSTGFMRPKKNGGFVEPFAPNEVTFGFTEGNSWQYSFFVPHDMKSLVDLHGGRDKFAAKLEELFTTDQKLAGREQADLTGLIGQYAHGNEPSHHIPYLFNYVEQPWKTQQMVRRIMDEFYKNSPAGLIGNEDCGQMSAWYILSAMGFYPVSPGSPEYDLGSPLFKEVKINLENGKTFRIAAPHNSNTNVYVRATKLNGKPDGLTRTKLKHKDIIGGGLLEFEMSSTPAPFKKLGGGLIHYGKPLVRSVPAVPAITAERTFAESTNVSFSLVTPDSRVHFTTDGSTPTADSVIYTKPFPINGTTTVKAIAITANGTKSFPVEATLTRRPHNWSVNVISGYSTQYTGGGDNAIVDGIRGTVNFASGEWQGIQGKPYEAVIDLQRETEIKGLGASFLQVAGPWIWMPASIKFEISNNGTDWHEAANINTDIPLTEMKPTMKDFRQTISPVKARYVRIRAFNIGKIPAWHLGAGGDPWIFVDELFIN